MVGQNTFDSFLLNSSFGLYHSDLFSIVEYIKSTISPMFTSTSSLTSVLESTSIKSTLTDTVTSPDHSSNGNGTS